MAPVVQVQNVFKKYSRNANAHLGYGMRDLFDHLLGRKPSLELRKDEFFAVNDVSFELEQGDTIALIGRNGSGKSTLLKMMNGIVKPDAGRIVMEGRVQALINLGAGFNPALSGLDNIYNAAALHGFNRKETKAIVEEVIDFAELEDFIESPVETYSSGMKARLGFAVAVHLKPDILLIDEILSVGDHGFQNKCYHRMQTLKKQGTTIVLVSHSKQAVLQICRMGVWIHNGKIDFHGSAGDTLHAYMKFMDELAAKRVEKENQGIAAPQAKKEEQADKTVQKKEPRSTIYGPIHDLEDHLEDLKVSFTCSGQQTDSIPIHSDITIMFEFALRHPVLELAVNFPIYREDGTHISTISSLNGDLLKDIHEGHIRCEVHIPDFDLNPGKHIFVMCVHDGKSYLYRDIVKIVVVRGASKHTWGIKDFNYEYIVNAPPCAAEKA